MVPEESVTRWITQLRQGDDQAPQELWNRYFEKLVRLASKHLEPIARRAADEEDVALSAFNNFFQGGTRPIPTAQRPA